MSNTAQLSTALADRFTIASATDMVALQGGFNPIIDG